jgi:hypothetical protein
MRKRLAILVSVCVLLVVALALRWPRLDPETVSVTRSEVSGDQMVVEYRMSRPFEVALGHRVRKLTKGPDVPEIELGNSLESRRDKVELVPSKYDLLRGEHYVRLAFSRGPTLSVDGNGSHFEFAPKSTGDVTGFEWLPPREGVRYGDSVGNDIVHFGSSSELKEYLILYAGTEVRRWVE